MNDYLRRSGKYFIYVFFFFLIAFIALPLISGESPIARLNKISQDRNTLLILAFVAVYSFIYPLLGFAKMKRHLNGTFSENKEVIEQAFETLGYVKSEEKPEKLSFRRKSKFARFMEMYEDRIVIYTQENPIIISGLRKRVSRINAVIDNLLLKAEA